VELYLYSLHMPLGVDRKHFTYFTFYGFCYKTFTYFAFYTSCYKTASFKDLILFK